MAVVPLTGEESFWALREYYAIPESATNYWVGAAPRLDLPDEAARYADTSYTDDFELVGPAARLSAFTWPDPEGVRITSQARFTGWSGGFGFLVLGFLTESSGPGWPLLHIDRNGTWDQVAVPADGEWHIVSVTLAPFAPSTFQPEAKAAAAAGALWVYATANPAEGSEVAGISWIQVETLGGTTPLQWRQRTDELGVSGVRPARHASTYQATNRARGML